MRFDHLDTEHRLYLCLLALGVFINFLNGGMAIFAEPESWTAKVANVTIYPAFIGMAFMVAAFAIIPLIMCLAHEGCNRRWVVKLGTAGMGVGAVTAFCIGYISRNMDLGWFTVYYIALGLFSLVTAGAFAAILNQQMKLRCPENTFHSSSSVG